MGNFVGEMSILCPMLLCSNAYVFFLYAFVAAKRVAVLNLTRGGK
mgnify:CR=1 FL=1